MCQSLQKQREKLMFFYFTTSKLSIIEIPYRFGWLGSALCSVQEGWLSLRQVAVCAQDRQEHAFLPGYTGKRKCACSLRFYLPVSTYCPYCRAWGLLFDDIINLKISFIHLIIIKEVLINRVVISSWWKKNGFAHLRYEKISFLTFINLCFINYLLLLI